MERIAAMKCLPLAAALLASAPAFAAPPPLKLFGQLPTVGKITLSPDGKRYAAIIGSDSAPQLQVRTTADNKVLSVTPAEKQKLRSLSWVGNDHVIATISNSYTASGAERREQYRLVALNVAAGGKWRELPASNVFGTPQALVRNGVPMLLSLGWHYYTDVPTLSLFMIDLSREGRFLIEKGGPDTIDFVTDSNGQPVARADYGSQTKEWRLLLKGKNGYQRVYSEVAPVDLPNLLSFGRDTSTVMFGSRKSGDWQDFEMTLADGSVAPAPADYAGDAVLLEPQTRTVIGTTSTGLEATSYRFLNPADQALWRGIAKAFPGERVGLESWSNDRKTIIVEVEGPTNGLALFTIDRTKGTVEYLADRYEGIGPELINPVTAYRYKAADGLEIPAYLTLPKGRPAKALPLIVLAHGGPEARDSPGFDWWAQALASRGYAVLQPQFRGSSGFGAALRDAGHGQWGRKMQTDLSDGVADLVTKGIADARRVCMVGASYGGYAAMAGVTVQQGIYRCASAVAGVSDLKRDLAGLNRSDAGRRSVAMRFWQRFMGARSADDPALDPISPARLADRVSVPLQLIHGKDDAVVPLEQSQLMRDAMAKAGKPVEYLELPGEDHWLSSPATRIAMLEAQVAFLERHNPPN